MPRSQRLHCAVLCALVFIICSSLSIAASAQSSLPGSVTYDAPVAGEITDSSATNTWLLTVVGNDRVAITVERINGNLIPTAEIRDNAGQTLATSYRNDNNDTAFVTVVDLPSAGTYPIIIGRDEGNGGSTSGRYLLTVTLAGTGETTPGFMDTNVDIIPSLPVFGHLDDKYWINSFGMNIVSRDHVLLTASRMDGDFVPELVLNDTSGQQIAASKLDETGTRAIIDLRFSTTGTYALYIRRQGGKDAATSGSYRLDYSVLGRGEDNEIFTIISGRLTFDTPTHGVLTNGRWKDKWAIAIDRPSAITITATRTGGTLIPALRLLDGQNTMLASAVSSDGQSAAIDHFQIKTSGLYFIEIGRMDGAAGLTSGKYELTTTK